MRFFVVLVAAATLTGTAAAKPPPGFPNALGKPHVGTAVTHTHSARYLLAAKLNRALAHTSFRGLGWALEREGRRWNVNPYLVAAIGGTESTFGAAACGGNAWGVASCGVSFGSFPEGVAYVSRLLRRDYINDGLASVESIGARYCQCGTSWAQHTRWFMGWLGDTKGGVTYG